MEEESENHCGVSTSAGLVWFDLHSAVSVEQPCV